MRKPATQPAPVTGRPRRLLTDETYRKRMFVFATHSELFNVSEVSRFMKVSRPTADQDLKDVLTLRVPS